MLSSGTILWLVFSELFALCAAIWIGYDVANDYGRRKTLEGVLTSIMVMCVAQIVCLGCFWIPAI